MKGTEGLPQWMGFFLLILGVLFIIPLFALIHMYSIHELWNLVVIQTGWSEFMIGWVVCAVFVVGLIFAYGFDIVLYHDKKTDMKSVEENAKSSKYKPINDNDENDL